MTTVTEVEIVDAKQLEQTRAELKVELDPFVAHAATVEIRSDEDLEEAAEYLGDLSRRAKMVEAKRLELKGPITKWGKEIDSYFKQLSEPIAEARKLVEPKILTYRQEKQRKIDEENAAREAEIKRQQDLEDARQRELAEKTAKELAEAEAAGDQEAARGAERRLAIASEVRTVVSSVEPLAQENTIRAAGASVSVRRSWKHTVVDPFEVPREYLMVNEKAIAEAVRKHGNPAELSIPGVVIEQAESLATKA